MIEIMFEEIEPFLLGADRHQCAFSTGEAVFHRDDPVSMVHFVTSGTIQLVRHEAGGAPLLLQRATPGAILAEASLHSDRYHCDAIAIGGASTWAIAKADLIRRLVSNPAFALAWTRRLAHEVQRARLQAEILSIKTVADRLDAWLAWHGSIPTKGDWIVLAGEIGVSPEALYRELSKRR